MSKNIQTLAIIVLIIGIGALAWFATPTPTTPKSSTAISGVQVGGAFALTDHHGNAITDQTWPEQYKLIFFGFTHCPDICPTELSKLTHVLEKLPQNIVDKIQPLFITVDPERDDVETMGAYVELFHPKIVGLTGTRPEIDQVVKDFRVYAAKQPSDDPDYYMVDHSAFLYLFKPDMTLVDVFSFDTTSDDIAQQLPALIQ